jgi:hypothetical protein
METSGGESWNFWKRGCTISLMAAVQTGALAPGPDHHHHHNQQQKQHPAARSFPETDGCSTNQENLLTLWVLKYKDVFKELLLFQCNPQSDILFIRDYFCVFILFTIFYIKWPLSFNIPNANFYSYPFSCN